MRKRSRNVPASTMLRIAVGVGAGCGALAAVAATGVHFARLVLTPARHPDQRVTVHEIERLPDGTRRVWIQGPDAALAGAYSFIFDAGASHVRLSPVRDRRPTRGGERIARDLLSEQRGALRVGARGRITGWWYTDPDELGFPTRLVRIPMAGGHSWGWVIEPEAAQQHPGRWAVHVHGRGALPEETLRGVSACSRAGMTSLVIAYRNDPGAPRGVRGRYGLGLAEWHDVDAAISWAREQGAARITLCGWSMGGTASVLAATRGAHRSMIDGLVLDSPALDWPGVLRQQARLAHAPGFIGRLGQVLLRSGWVRGAVPGERGTDLRALTPERLIAELRAPVLIHASPEDEFVPWQGARVFASLRPDLVRLRVGAGEHVKLWNVDPTGWETDTERFVRELPPPAAHSPGHA